MTIRTDYPHRIREIENEWVPLADGTLLAARIWLPEDAEQNPVPAILEYIPYRKDDGTALRDSTRHPYFAGHGYACVRVDMRGSGDADGLLEGEYLPQEQADGLEVIAWIAAQPWCSGSVGMMGISWGGFNSLQVAARRPPALKAIITLCSTDDRYADDIHFMGGCLMASDMFRWGAYMLAFNVRPPDPRFVGDRWREMWLDRLEHNRPWVHEWMEHQLRDEFWKQGSVRENYADIECAVFAVSGWADGYPNSVPRLLAGLPGPKLGLLGPWGHSYPHVAIPGPQIGFLQECLRWWDHWLKGTDTGIMDEPGLRAWMQDSIAPETFYAERPGQWAAEREWPSPHIREQRLWLAGDSLTAHAAPEEASVAVASVQTHGLHTGKWSVWGSPGDWPSDQRAEDAVSACFTSAPLEAPCQVLGYPEATLTLSADRPNALAAVRLCDVGPDGTSTLVSHGLLNLTHREGHEQLEPMEPGRRCTVKVQLKVIGYAMAAGHRWRVAVSPTYWPRAWPSPQPVTLTLHLGPDTYLELPVREPRPEADSQVHFEAPEMSAEIAHEILRPATRERGLHHDLVRGVTELADTLDSGVLRLLPSGLEQESIVTDTYTIADGDPLSASVRCERSLIISRSTEGWHTRIETDSRVTADAEAFHLSDTVEAYEGETQVFARTWTHTVRRDFV